MNLIKNTACALVVLSLSSAECAQSAPRRQLSRSNVVTLSRTVATLLRQNNTRALSRYVDASKGLQFSPDVYATRQDVKLDHNRVARLKNDKTIRVWGTYDGEDGPIRLNWNNYRKKFVWNRDFTRGARISVNRAPGGRSTVINNLRQFYPGSTRVEFYLPPTSNEGMDWSSLWMIWKKRGTTWRLIGIAHDQWSP